MFVGKTLVWGTWLFYVRRELCALFLGCIWSVIQGGIETLYLRLVWKQENGTRPTQHRLLHVSVRINLPFVSSHSREAED